MLKVLQFLKKSLVSVFLIIILLIIQAYLDLTLPEYTSKIINVGVQQNGIENAVITKISKTSLDKLLLFATEKEEEFAMLEKAIKKAGKTKNTRPRKRLRLSEKNPRRPNVFSIRNNPAKPRQQEAQIV